MNVLTPLITVIIPTYNRVNIIPTAISSIIAQTYQNWECLVIDDGSTDNTFKIIEEFLKKDTRIKYFSRDRLPKGAPTCRNIGMENARGEYLMFLDSDDYLLPHCLEHRINAFGDNTKFDFLIFPMGIKLSQSINKHIINTTNDYLIQFLSANILWQTMCPIWKRDFLLGIKGFTEGYPRLNDLELMIRALMQSVNNFKVFNEKDFDCVHIPGQMEKVILSDKVFLSLNLFIPDICEVLDRANQKEYKKYLVNYLKLWFKACYIPLRIKNTRESLKLIKLFGQYNIIGLCKQIEICFYLYCYTYSEIFKSKFRIRLKASVTYIRKN